MPITLGCPSCGKRFRARDESAGKRVKCPFCQAAVPVPSSEAAQNAAAPTDEVPVPKSVADSPLPDRPSAAPAPPPRSDLKTLHFTGPLPPATPGDWGADSGPPPAPPPAEPVFPVLPPPSRPGEPVRKDRPLRPAGAPAGTAAVEKPPELAAAWRRTRSGLFWVQFALFWFAVLAAVPVGEMVYERTQGPIPDGPGSVTIEGYVNSKEPESIQIGKREEIDILAFGVPTLLGGLALVFGRLTAGAAPRNSGAKGLFALSGLFTLIALAGLGTWLVCDRLLLREPAGYGRSAALLGLGVGEFWFLIALAAAGATLRRPNAVRAVGFVALVVGLGAVVATTGWDLYQKYGAELGRPKVLDRDWQLYEEAARLLGWLVVIGAYCRAVGSVRRAISDTLAGSGWADEAR